ncbi:MAG: hypothetical protein MJA27_13190 [Pseudanabaenales cyanobacterium]|nr:hypothetical protein [Pseudanabaenales cyanobacterium]
MSPTLSLPEKFQPVLYSEVERLQNIVRRQQEQISVQQQIIDRLEQRLKKQGERVEQLEAELKVQKKLKGQPKIPVSRLNESKTAAAEGEEKKHPGSTKRSKKLGFGCYEEKIIQPDEIPEKAKFNGYRDYDVQELNLECHHIRFRLVEYISEAGITIVGELPSEYRYGHYGPLLVGYIIYHYLPALSVSGDPTVTP